LKYLLDQLCSRACISYVAEEDKSQHASSLLNVIHVTLPEVAKAACLCLCRFVDKMRSFAISLHFLCFAVVFIRKIYGLYEDQAGLFDW